MTVMPDPDATTGVSSATVRCRPCRAGVHDFCERILDPNDDACMCSHDPARDPVTQKGPPHSRAGSTRMRR